MSFVPGSLVKRYWSEIDRLRSSSLGWDTEQLLSEVGLVISVRTQSTGVGVLVLCTVLWPDGSVAEGLDTDSLKIIEQEAP